MDSASVVVFRSPDSRLKTSKYMLGGGEAVCVAERTSNGILLTEFDAAGQVLSQRTNESKDALEGLCAYLEIDGEPEVREVKAYERIPVSAKCNGCNEGKIVRQLDLVDPININKVPVVPIFICLGCSKKFYSMTENYLRLLAKSNSDLFTKEELGEMNADEDAFIGVLQEYIIRIFASKKISRMNPV
ncbi:MAG: hypothetical protein KGH72_00975 [Candidatus Micrarchaeota archaeon]|nr:hypothetical protein [Candidatus Micrarchaeota archaeon]